MAGVADAAGEGESPPYVPYLTGPVCNLRLFLIILRMHAAAFKESMQLLLHATSMAGLGQQRVPVKHLHLYVSSAGGV